MTTISAIYNECDVTKGDVTTLGVQLPPTTNIQDINMDIGLTPSPYNHLGEHVNKNHNCIISSPGFWQLDNEVHGNMFPRVGRSGHQLK